MDQHQRSLQTQLCRAVKDEDPRSIQTLLSQGADANMVLNQGAAAVHLAVGKESEKSLRCLKLLLQHGADPNVRSSEGLTPLHVAALWGCYQNVKLLLANGGNPHVKDQEGNTPGQFAEQQDNRKCAQILQRHQAQSAAPEEDLPPFHYTIYSDQTDLSSYSESDSSSVSSRLSLLSDCGADPLSSTRHSAVFDGRASTRPQPWWREGPWNGCVDMNPIGGALGPDPYKSKPSVRGEGPSFLSSTRMSTVGVSSTEPVLQEDVLLGDVTWMPNPTEGPSLLSSTRLSMARPALPDDPVANNDAEAPVQSVHPPPPAPEGRRPVLDGDAPAAPVHRPSRRASRKSVSFSRVDEYVPHVRPQTPEPSVDTVAFDSSEFLRFLNPERSVTVLHRQGIDVTSPDHVHVFDWDSSKEAEVDMEKTVISNFRLEEGEETEEEEEEEEEEEQQQQGGEGRELGGQTPSPEQPSGSVAGGNSSGSQYSSCDSDHYTTAHFTTVRCSSSGEEARDAGVLKCESQPPPTVYAVRSQDGQILAQQREQEAVLKQDQLEDVPAQVDNLLPSDPSHATDSNPELCSDLSEKVVQTADDDEGGDVTAPEPCSPVAELPFTPSPFVTGRTRSRLSRCSIRTSQTPDNLSAGTSLFEMTLPMPVRSQRKTLRSRGSDDVFYNSPYVQGRGPPRATGDLSGSSFSSGSPETLSSWGVCDSQADTFILPRGGGAHNGPPSPSLPDTIILERRADSPTLAQIEDFAPEPLSDDMAERDFLTDDRSSSDQVDPQRKPQDAGAEQEVALKNKEVSWITEDSGTDAEPGSSSSSSATSSSSCYFSPPRRGTREASSETPCTPGAPRYSISRLSPGQRWSQNHQALRGNTQACSPGRRPAAPDPEEPVEYLYTDTEQGHELIETHIPPMANTSTSTSSDETVLYDWRSLRLDLTESLKENRTPRKKAEQEAKQLQIKMQEEEEEKKKKEEEEVKRCSMLPDTKGVTDQELRRRLLELGESPGPISARTRPVYMRRLCRLILESNLQSPQRQPQGQSHADSGYSAELTWALRTFDLPDCHAAELELCQQFDKPEQNRKWREGVIKSSFNYLLLDPRVTKNLPYRSRTMSPQECFQTFVRAIFYVGKGKRSRPYSHLYEALEYFKGDKTSKKLCSKVQHILQVWGGGEGVVSLHCFQNVIPVEAFTREACMVDAIGLKRLTNQKRGDYYGVVSTWQASKRRELGVHLLSRAMQIFLAEGERQLRPADIRQ